MSLVSYHTAMNWWDYMQQIIIIINNYVYSAVTMARPM